jgi:hypothetical protein
MTGKKGTGSENPWIKPKAVAEPDELGSETQLPLSPLSQEVPPRPSPWGDKVSAPSLRRPSPESKRRKLPPLLLPIAAGVAVVALLAVALVLLTGGNDTAEPQPTSPISPISPTPPTSSTSPTSPTSPTVPVTTPTPPTYSPPPNAIAVDFGVSVVPVEGWSVLAKETQGKQLISYAPNGDPRAFFWVRQKENMTANTYLLRIVEGETEGEIAQLGNVRKLACPRDVLVECLAISYTSTAKAGQVKGFVEAYRRKDGVVTAIDFRSRTDFTQKAEPDAETMKKSVLDSL